MADIDDAITYYKDLLLYQYINAPKAYATIGVLANGALVDLLPIELNDAFNLETAQGPQLDILGEYIGFSRNVSIPVSRNYFAFEDSDTPYGGLYGLTDYDTTLNNDSFFYSYNDASGSSATLNDDEYRILLKLKAYTNRSNHSLGEINDFIYSLFGSDLTMVDNFDMSIEYYVNPSIAGIISIAKDNEFLPKPMGVAINFLLPVADFDILFSFDPSAGLGLTDYNSAVNSTGSFISYEDAL